jgi:hypothetical protein
MGVLFPHHNPRPSRRRLQLPGCPSVPPRPLSSSKKACIKDEATWLPEVEGRGFTTFEAVKKSGEREEKREVTTTCHRFYPPSLSWVWSASPLLSTHI